jgi:hypothetical protein
VLADGLVVARLPDVEGLARCAGSRMDETGDKREVEAEAEARSGPVEGPRWAGNEPSPRAERRSANRATKSDAKNRMRDVFESCSRRNPIRWANERKTPEIPRRSICCPRSLFRRGHVVFCDVIREEEVNGQTGPSRLNDQAEHLRPQ